MSPFRLLNLPPELRDSIYEYIIISGSLTKLLRLSRQVRNEAIQVLHRKATYGGSLTSHLWISLPHQETPGGQSGQGFDEFYRQNKGSPVQDRFMVNVDYGRGMHGRRVTVDLDKMREPDSWWSLVLDVVLRGPWPSCI